MEKHYLGLDVGGTNFAAGVVNERGRLIAKYQMPIGSKKGVEELTEAMYQVSSNALKMAGLAWDDVPYWGIGMPSTVNAATGVLVHANCFGWHNVPIYSYLSRFISKEIFIENDANCATLAEVKVGAAKGAANVIMLTLGTGVGGGIVINGQLYPGANGLGAELGHTKLVKDGRLCTCGQRGCLEAYASATALIGRAKEMALEAPESSLSALLHENELNGASIFMAAENGDNSAAQLIDEYAEYLAAGISSFVSIFRPEKVILGGGLSNAGDALFQPVREKLMQMTFGAEEIGVPEVVRAKLGNDAGIIGAALLRIEKK